MTVTLYGDPISGNCLKAKWTAEYLGIDHNWVPLDILNGDSRSEAFLKINPFGQVPTAVLDDGRVLTQSNAIVLYLAEMRDGGLLPDDTYDRGKVYQWMFWEQNSHEPYVAGRRFRKAFLGRADDEIDAEWLPRGNAALQLMEEHLASSTYFVGGALTAADIVLVAYTRWANEGGFELSSYPNVREWVARVERDLDISSSSEAS